MIEINLIGKKKSSRLPVVLGVDFNLINFKALAAAFVIGYGGKFYFISTWDKEVKETEEKTIQIKNEIKEFDEKTKNNQDLKKVLETYNKQMDKLKDREKVVAEVLKRRNNPRAFLERLARNTPSDLWFTSLSLDSNQMLELKGRSLSYKSIGDFSVLISESKFMNGRKLELKSSETVEEKDGDSSRRIESFTLVGKLESL